MGSIPWRPVEKKINIMELCRACKNECNYVLADIVIRHKFYNKPVIFERFDCPVCGNIQATKWKIILMPM